MWTHAQTHARTQARTHTWTPARVPSYKLTLWAFGSGELKKVMVNPGSSFEKKAQWHGHTTTWYKFWQQFKAFIIPTILYQFQKDSFCLIILYDILFYFIHVYIIPGQEERQPLRTFFYGSRKVFSLWSLVACFKNSTALWFYAHFFPHFTHVHLMSTGRPHHFGHFCKFKKNLFNFWLYIHLFML